MDVGNVFSVGVAGLHRQIDAMNGAADDVLVASTAPSTPDRVDVSAHGKAAAAGGIAGDSAPTSGLEGAMVDLRVAKYLAVANMKVLQTGDDMARELSDLVGRR